MEAEQKKKKQPSYRCPTCGKVLPRAKRSVIVKAEPKVISGIVERGGPVLVQFN